MVKDSEPRKSLGGEGESEEDEEDEPVTDQKKPNSDEGTASSEVNATEEMSTLVNYIEPVKFKSFEVANKRRKYFEMSSLVETKGMDILKASPIKFVEYNKNQLSRIYPKGTRMVALNFQTLDLPMQLNMGVFEYNGHSGYLLKPEFMRRTDKQFDPFTENIVDGIVANTVKIRVISGQFLTDKKVGVVVLPTLAALRIAVVEENGKVYWTSNPPCVSHKTWTNGEYRYHYINLKSELNQPLILPSLLVYTEAQDYIPNEHQEYAEALTNPIKHISQLHKRETQLAVLIEDNSEHIPNQPKERESKGEWEVFQGPSPFPNLPPCLPVEAPDIIKPHAQVVQSPKEDLIATVLADIQVQSIEELKQQKGYLKLQKKQSKELKEIQKKHLKKVWNLSKEQKSRSSQLQSDTQRRRSQMEKHLKRSIRKNESNEPVQRELTALDQELEKQSVQLREWQMQELLKLRQQLHLPEREKQQTYLQEAFKKLKETANECQAAQLKKLKETCEKEKKELQRIMDRKRQNSISDAKTRDKDKAETELNEINRKHIQDSVSLIGGLEEAQTRRQDKLMLRHREMLQHIDDELPLLQSQLERDLDQEYERLQEEICQHLQVELHNKGLRTDALYSPFSNQGSPRSGPPSNCSTPDRCPWNRSMDNSTASLADSTSSSTPVLSEAEMSFS
ncbi:hypothetical protein KUCAC02_000426 [Chaenocephalus aceratus]|uniref:Uncharacterized protein n=1 Tax=Chaenocephalus aceratus TaxID=36190 RepID=A0ACB9W5I4_CHAAC|nr:hypothetical protein KUCAC02_000426 [Chaenocephalus aceratus]